MRNSGDLLCHSEVIIINEENCHKLMNSGGPLCDSH